MNAERASATYIALRTALFLALGDQCELCGETDRRVFMVDHREGGGEEDRRRYSGTSYYRHLLRLVRTGRLRLLCGNCSMRADHKRRRAQKGGKR